MATPPLTPNSHNRMLAYEWQHEWQHEWQRAMALPVFFLAVGLYALTLAPTVVTVFDDSLEFQLVTYVLGVAHPTGYPLYTLLGWLFTRLPLGDVAYRVNLLSAVCGGLTVALVYLTGLELTTRGSQAEGQGAEARRRWAQVLAALIGASALAVAPVFWSQATVAEVYTLNAAFVAGMLWLLVRSTSPPSAQFPLDMAFLFGLSLTHHRTMLLMLPATSYYLWPQFKTWRPRSWIKITVALLVPLLLYLYIPLRGHVGSLDGTYANTLEGFWKQVTAGGYGVFLFEDPFGAERGPGFYLSLFLEQFGFIGLAAGLAGLMVVCRLRAGRLTLIAFGTYFVFNLLYRVADIEVFFIPLFLIWAIWIGVAAGWLLTGRAWLNTRRPSWLRLTVTLLTVLLLLGQLAVTFLNRLPEMNRSGDWTVYDYGLDVMGQPMEPKAAVVGILGEVTLMRYFQETSGLRSDLLLMAADREAERLTAVEHLLDQGRAVYLTRELPGAPARWPLRAVGPLIQVMPEPILTAPETAYPLGSPLTPEITLDGYNISRLPAHAGQPAVRLTLVWKANAPISRELKVSARLVDPDGQPVAQTDAVPVHFAYPTTAWRPNEFIRDVYDLALPAMLQPGEYNPVIILYDPARGAAEVGRVTLPPLHLP